MRRSAALLALILLAATGCRGDDAVGDPAPRLESQREDVRRAAAELATSIAARTEGEIVDSQGIFRGCDTTLSEQYTSYRYTVWVRVEGHGSLGTSGPVDDDAGDGVDVWLQAFRDGGTARHWLAFAEADSCIDASRDDVRPFYDRGVDDLP